VKGSLLDYNREEGTKEREKKKVDKNGMLKVKVKQSHYML
jgi:hypothetical protein